MEKNNIVKNNIVEIVENNNNKNNKLFNSLSLTKLKFKTPE